MHILTHESNPVFVEKFWQLRVLGRMAPASPHSLHKKTTNSLFVLVKQADIESVQILQVLLFLMANPSRHSEASAGPEPQGRLSLKGRGLASCRQAKAAAARC